MPIPTEELARRLREAREASGLTQDEVAGELGLSRPSVVQLEQGNRAVSGLELDRLAHLYGRDLRDFLAEEFRAEDSLVALFRSESTALQDEVRGVVRECMALARELANLEALLGLDRSHVGAPSYSVAPPRTKGQAVGQGNRVAGEERRRLGLGFRPLGDVSGLLEGEGVRTAMVDLPEEVSGLTLMEPSLSLFVVANRRHHLLRRRFSWVHEYAHVLFDRNRKGTLSRSSNQSDLLEVRANAFAAAFLLPEEGLRDFLVGLGKGYPRRERLEIFDGQRAVLAESRAEPGSQSLQLYDIVLLAHHFQVSRKALLHRLRNLHLLSEAERDRFLAEDGNGEGRALARLMRLPEPEHAAAREEFRSRFLSLALEAHRREKITRGKLREVCGLVGFSEIEVDQMVASMDLDGEGQDVLLPGEGA
jgi:Zn-dependent peptidase ImmA (M78 family)/transcriptional regulator with XRE-family HTH domain